jgi:hypothetical protein
MNWHYVVSIVFAAALLAGCSGPSSALGTAHEIGVSKLRQDLQGLAKSPAGQQHDIPQSAWPDSVRRFHPQAVQLHMNGILIVLGKAAKEQRGLLVMLEPNEDPGAGGSGVDYESLGEGLYWCNETIRAAFVPPAQRTNK